MRDSKTVFVDRNGNLRLDTMMLLKTGSLEQRQTAAVIEQLGILENLQSFQPVVCGTYPLCLQVETSDIDIILFAENFLLYKTMIYELFDGMQEYTVKEKHICGEAVVLCSFRFEGLRFELFAQAKPVWKQNAYLHLVIEYEILKEKPNWHHKILELKLQGLKTEAAFCKMLNLIGDPYKALLLYGRKKEYIG